MEKLKISHTVLLSGFTLALLVHAQDQSGFISLDCGTPADSSYNDEITNITYISDANFTDAGVPSRISSDYHDRDLQRQFSYVRSFPSGKRNCYTLNPAQGRGGKYLIRARFQYGNYDGLSKFPKFHLHLGVNPWDTIIVESASSIVTSEIIHVPSTEYISVCLVNTDQGTPFISTLEIRVLDRSIYVTQTPSEALLLVRRLDFGSTTNQLVRYPGDKYDRIWTPKNSDNWNILSTLPENIDKYDENSFQPARAVMSTAITPKDVGESLTFLWDPSDGMTYTYYFYVHFFEVMLLGNRTRTFNLYVNGELSHRHIVPNGYNTVFSTKPRTGMTILFTVNKTDDSTLPPILNAMELYTTKNFSQLSTHNNDVDAIVKIKANYGVKRNWQGDPCVPQAYRWDGLNCSYVGNDPPRIVSLSLSSSGLIGEIAPYIANLVFVEYLDLSNNSLSGTVPEFLSQLPSLKYLNLTRNMLTGSLPHKLEQKWKNGSLILSLDENPNICLSASCKRKKNKVIVPLVASFASVCAVLTALSVLCHLKWRKKQVVGKLEAELETRNDPFASKNPQFTFSDVLRITNNFARVLGKGGFGTVYYGCLSDNQEVAVKMLSSSSAQGYKEFHAEVKLLMRVHHRNLTNLVGYCIEGTNMGLVYEFMANGNLQNYLSGKNEHVLSWEERVRIALDAAQGLEYLHNGCKPPIVHRDVKPSNILLNEKLQAKIADFGISRIFVTEGGSHISTSVAGTPGYLDPEHNWLNEKSDVYSFGVVLLEIITCRPVIVNSPQNSHISQWVSFMLAKGDISRIVDPRLEGNFNTNSAWKASELGLACASDTFSIRPTMLEVVMELKQCLAMAMDGNEEGLDNIVGINLDTEISPLAR